MTDRLFILIGLVSTAIMAYQIIRRWQVQRIARLASSDPLLGKVRPGIPAIVYFTSPFCAPCKTQQRPAIQQVIAEMGDTVQVIEVDALEQPDIADRWGVLSVPTTFILDRRGRAQTINNGVARADKLRQQLQGL